MVKLQGIASEKRLAYWHIKTVNPQETCFHWDSVFLKSSFNPAVNLKSLFFLGQVKNPDSGGVIIMLITNTNEDPAKIPLDEVRWFWF